jgi:calcium-translocating P-type ATPase
MDLSKREWEHMTLEEIRRLLASRSDEGLSESEALRRLSVYGENKLTTTRNTTFIEKVFAQLLNPLSIVLVCAGVVTYLLTEYVDASVIAIALLINVIVGAFQEARASKAFEKLSASQERHAIVIRDGKRLNIRVELLVPGDMVLLQGGYFVPADMRLLEEKDITVNEAALTGEWLAVEKNTKTLDKETPLAERCNMVWMGTLIESGYGTGIVVATGNKTQLGDIARSLASIEEQDTPLQRNIKHIAKVLSYAVAISLVGIFLLGFLRDQSLHEMLLVAIAVAVATIPAGLPAALTIVLAIGMEAILKRGGLVRNLLAAETLGGTTVILTDKTGTLTEGRMKLSSLHSYTGIRTHSEIPTGDNRFLLELAVLYSDAFIEEEGDAPSKLTVHGRPIEKAVVLSGLECGVVQEQLLKDARRLDYLQFTSSRRFGASLHHNPHKKTNRLIVTGEPEKLLAYALHIRVDNKREKATAHEKKRFQEILLEKAGQGKRIIGVAYSDVTFDKIPETADEVDDLLANLVIAGFMAFEDPIRTDVHASIQQVKRAGAQVIMLTGDNPETARYIAREVGIVLPGDELVITGTEIDAMNDAELLLKLEETRVIARAVPAHKLRIARLLKGRGEVVAMTGDGINDAPALRAASIGIAVGSGTEIAKEASDLVLIDNSFSIIVSAIEEGRRILDNLKKIVAYLLSTSFSEIFLITGALIGGAPVPLVPAQILWANIVGGDLMSFAFAFEKKDPTAMERNPRSADSKNILTRDLAVLVAVLSVVTGLFTVGLYYLLLSLNLPIEEIRTCMFVALSLDAIFFSFSLKSFDTPVWRIDILSNPHLLGALGVSVGLLFCALLFPPLQTLLSLAPLTPLEKLLLLGIGIVNLCAIEVTKYFIFGRTAQKN